MHAPGVPAQLCTRTPAPHPRPPGFVPAPGGVRIPLGASAPHLAPQKRAENETNPRPGLSTGIASHRARPRPLRGAGCGHPPAEPGPRSQRPVFWGGRPKGAWNRPDPSAHTHPVRYTYRKISIWVCWIPIEISAPEGAGNRARPWLWRCHPACTGGSQGAHRGHRGFVPRTGASRQKGTLGRSPDHGRRPQHGGAGAEDAPAGTGHRVPGTGYRTLGTGHRVPGTGHRAPAPPLSVVLNGGRRRGERPRSRARLCFLGPSLSKPPPLRDYCSNYH